MPEFDASASAVVHECPAAVRTLACVVTYEPDRNDLLDLALDLKGMAGLDIVLIDNSESESGKASVDAVGVSLEIRVLRNAFNRGLGAAHNRGVELARELGCERLLLLDQDTRISSEAVQRLHGALDALIERGVPVAAVGPAFVDPNCGEKFPFVRLGRGLRMRHVVHGESDLVECDLLISSGSLIPLSVFEGVGRLDEALFVDYVDVEWCVRAQANGMRVFGVPAAVMTHTVGEARIRRLGRWLPLHNPVRQYYVVRNALLFARKPYLSWRWRMHLVTRALAQIAVYAGTCAPRLERVRWLGLGFIHGLIGRDGRLGGPKGLAVRPASAPVNSAATPSLNPTSDEAQLSVRQ